jgi:hypothetical protein
MTISSETNRSGPYLGNGVTTIFDYEFKIVNEDHIKVIKTDTEGVESVLTIDADYVVSDVGNNAGGQVAMVSPPATGETITLLLNVPFTQETDLENQGAYFAETMEAAFDLGTQRSLQLKEEVDRAVKIPASADVGTLDSLITSIIRVSDSADNIDAVIGIKDDVSAVAAIVDKVTTVAARDTDIGTVAARDSDIGTVADRDADIGTVADRDADIGIVADNAAAVATAAENIDAIIAAPAQAASAAASAAAAASSKSDASDIAATVAADKVTTGGYKDDAEAAKTAAQSAQAAAESARDTTLASFDSFDDRYLGAKASDPATDNDGDALVAGALYFNSTDGTMKLYTGSEWVAAYVQGDSFYTKTEIDNRYPGSAADGDIAVFDGATGKVIKDGGSKISDLMPKAGGTFTGNVSMGGALTIGLGTATTNLVFSKGSSTQSNNIQGKIGNLTRWVMSLGDSDPESGADAGSNLTIYNYHDDGSYIGNILKIIRKSGGVIMSGATGGDPGSGKINAVDFKINGTSIADTLAAKADASSIAPAAVMEDQKASGTDGGTFTAGAWQTRTFNTKVRDPGGLITLASNQFTPAVDGWVEWSAPAGSVSDHQTRLYNVTDGAAVAYGTSELTSSANAGANRSFGCAAVAAGKTYRIEHRCATTHNDTGMGSSNGFGGPEIYTRVQFWRT